MIKTKLLLSYLRTGDYAHAGDSEAIELVMKKLDKDPNQLMLDAGCGLGGTAHYIQQKGWGKVIGIDLNEAAVNYAKKTYPAISFYLGDVIEVDNLLRSPQFDTVYLFNAFYGFQQQKHSLEALSDVAKKKGKLILFDYSSLNKFESGNPFIHSSNKFFTPICMDNIEELLFSSGWLLEETINFTSEYRRWYEDIISRLTINKSHLIEKFDRETFEKVYGNFSQLLDLLHRNILGGVTVYATKR